MNQKQNLYLITDGFPYGQGEKSFILPELPYLMEEYRLTIISPAPEAVAREKEYVTQLDSGIRLVHLPLKPMHLNQAMCDNYCAHPLVQEEFREIEAEDVLTNERKKDAMIYFAWAEDFFQQILVSGAINFRQGGIVYTYWYTYKTLAIALHLSQFPNLKLITRTHNYDLYHHRAPNGRQAFRKYMQEKLHGIFFVSHKGLGYYQETFMAGMGTDRLHYCPLGVKGPSAIHFPPPGPRTFHLVSCSFVIPLKRVDLIVKALALCDSDMQIHWTHFGDGVQMKEICDLAVKLLGKKRNIRVDFMGYCHNETIMQFYEKNDVSCFITTSSNEGLPVSIQEALAYGIPVIGTNVGGIHEEIDGNGVLLPENPSVEEIADAIRKVYGMSDSELRAWRERSHQLWDERFNSEKNTKRFLEILRTI